MKTIIELVYSLLIGVAVALFIGSGVWAIYPGPKAPEFPKSNFGFSSGKYYNELGSLTEEGLKAQEEDNKQYEEYDNQYRQFEKDQKAYHQLVAAIVLVPAVISFLAGIWLMKRSSVLGEGLALGGIISSVYALGRAWASNHRIIVFAAVSVILAMAVILVFVKFHPNKPRKSK